LNIIKKLHLGGDLSIEGLDNLLQFIRNFSENSSELNKLTQESIIEEINDLILSLNKNQNQLFKTLRFNNGINSLSLENRLFS